MVTIRKNYLPGRPETQTQKHNGKHIIVIHNTATPNATAKNEEAYFHREWFEIQAYVHAFVDWTGEAVEIAEPGRIAWGAGNVNPYAWLQVEQCISTDPEKTKLSAHNVADYVALTMSNHGFSFDDVSLISHADASLSFGGTDHADTIEGIKWSEFVELVKQKTTKKQQTTQQTTPRTTPSTNGNPSTSGTFRCSYNINARKDGPDTNNAKAYLFRAGDDIKYDRRIISNGYEWISQPRASGGFWYIPIREIKGSEYWGTFKK